MPLLMLAVWRWAAAEQRQAERHELLVSDTQCSVSRESDPSPNRTLGV
jgi:hypothetical protein